MSSTITEQLAMPSIKLAAFEQSFEKSMKRVRNKIQDYIIDADEENIHDLRTSIRRFDASFRLMPKKIRKDPSAITLRDQYKRLFKINSEIRDIDIIHFEFTHYIHVAPIYPNFLEALQKHKDKKLSKAREIALSAYELKPLKVKKASISKKKLLSRYKKVTTEFANEIERLFPVVISDVEKAAELHELRKDCKKMRYILDCKPKWNYYYQGQE